MRSRTRIPARKNLALRLNCVRGVLGCAGAVLLLSVTASAAERPLNGDPFPTKDGKLVIHPINHATLALGWKDLTIYVDPVGNTGRYANLPKPDLVLITDIHEDHFSAGTLKVVTVNKTVLVAPPAVAEKLPADLRQRTTVLTNGATQTIQGIPIEAVPMYNTTRVRTNYHPRGRGNGYVLTFADKRVYISGDTEDTPEMRALKDIDVAVVCMNLPYTMSVQQAADAVRQMHPRVVYPYHYRDSDVKRFKELLADQKDIIVSLRDWYKH